MPNRLRHGRASTTLPGVAVPEVILYAEEFVGFAMRLGIVHVRESAMPPYQLLSG